MKMIRSVDIYFKHLTDKKKEELSVIRKEYHLVLQQFIDQYQDKIPEKTKNDFRLREYTGTVDTWLSARMIQNAIGEAWDLVNSTKESCKEKKIVYRKPKHKVNKMVLSSQICSICLNPRTKEFDLNVTLCSIGDKKKVSIPLKKHRQFNKWFTQGKLCSSITLFSDHVQFSFKVSVEDKRVSGSYLGVDIGMNILLADSNGNKYGLGILPLIKKLNRRKRCSKAWYKCKTEIQEYIDLTVKLLPWATLRLLVCENLKNMKYKTKRRLGKNMRRVISNWNYRYVLQRLKMLAEENRVSFRSVSPYNTSITCSSCSHTDKGNRLIQELFCCTSCGHSENADINASKVILNRFLTGKYGSCFQGNES